MLKVIKAFSKISKGNFHSFMQPPPHQRNKTIEAKKRKPRRSKQTLNNLIILHTVSTGSGSFFSTKLFSPSSSSFALSSSLLFEFSLRDMKLGENLERFDLRLCDSDFSWSPVGPICEMDESTEMYVTSMDLSLMLMMRLSQYASESSSSVFCCLIKRLDFRSPLPSFCSTSLLAGVLRGMVSDVSQMKLMLS